MIKTKTIILLLPIVLLLFSCKKEHESKASKDSSVLVKDDFFEKCRKLVVSENKIGQKFSFKAEGKEIDELEIQYLGCIVRSNNDTLKIVNNVNYTGLYEDSRRASASLFLYDSHNKNIGHYYLGHLLSLPSEIKDNSLVFDYKNEQCDQITIVNFQDSIPKQIFINCTNKGGDLYTFEK